MKDWRHWGTWDYGLRVAADVGGGCGGGGVRQVDGHLQSVGFPGSLSLVPCICRTAGWNRLLVRDRHFLNNWDWSVPVVPEGRDLISTGLWRGLPGDFLRRALLLLLIR